MASREIKHRSRIAFASAVTMIAAALAIGVVIFRQSGRPSEAEPVLAVVRDERHAAEIQLQLNRCSDAEQSCLRALASLDGLADRAPGNPRYRRERAAVVETLALCQVVQASPHEAVPAYKEAIDLWSKLLAEEPSAFDVRCRLADCLRRLGSVYHDAGRWDEAESTLIRGRLLCEKVPASLFADPRVTRDRARFLDLLGRLYLDAGRQAEALEVHTIAVTTQRDLAGSAGGNPDDRERLASLLINQARAYAAVSQSVGAERALVDARDVAEGLRTTTPVTPRYHELAATALDLLARLIARDRKRRAEAQDLLGRAIAMRESLVANAPSIAENRVKLAATHAQLASLCRDQQALDHAEAHYRSALTALSLLANEHTDVLSIRFEHGRVLNNLAELVRGRGRPAEALSLARQAVERLGPVYTQDVKNAEYRTAFSHACWTLCAVLVERGDHRAAAEAVAVYLKIEPNGYEEPLEAARFLCKCAKLCGADHSLPADDRAFLTNKYGDQAMTALVIAVRNGFRERHDLETSTTYNPLRARDEFQRVLREVERTAG